MQLGRPANSGRCNGNGANRVPFIGEAARQFIVNGLDMHNITATGFPDCFPINFAMRGGRGDVPGGVLGQVWGVWLQVTCPWFAVDLSRSDATV